MGWIGRLRERRSERSDAAALQLALDTYERFVASAVPVAEARSRAAAHLDAAGRAAFALATAVASAAAPMPEPDFANVLEHRLREAGATPQVVLRPAVRRAPVRVLVPVAACLLAAVVVGRGAAVSLPGDGLYGIKEAGRSVRLGVTSGRSDAIARVRFAGDRFAEVDKLMARERRAVVGVPGSDVAAASRAFDPKVARLVASTLEKARDDLEHAARALLASPDSGSLVLLQQVARQGQVVVEKAAAELPSAVIPPVLSTSVSFQQIADQATGELAKLEQASPTPGPCATPTPIATPTPSPTPAPTRSPTPTPSPAPTAKTTPTPSPSPASTPSPKPSPTPEATPVPTPCVTPAPSPTPTPAPSARPSSTPGETPASSAEPQGSQAPEQPEPTQEPEPSGQPEAASGSQVPSAGVSTPEYCGFWQRFFRIC